MKRSAHNMAMPATEMPAATINDEQEQQDPVRLMVDAMSKSHKTSASEANLDLKNQIKIFKRAHSLILQLKWHDAMIQLNEHPNAGLEWFTSKDSQGSLLFRQLPIHSACRLNAPLYLIDQLLYLYPAGVKKVDENGRLALHHAFCDTEVNLEVVQKLMSIYPAGINDRDDKGMVPTDMKGGDDFNRKLKQTRNIVSANSAPTDPLYMLILAKKWDGAILRLKSRPNEASEWTESTNTKEKLLVRKLPIHLACRYNAPYTLMSLLIQSFPDGVRAIDLSGKLPLHYSSNAKVDYRVVEKLVHYYSEGKHVRDSKGMLPIDFAQKLGASDKVKNLLQIVDKMRSRRTVKLSMMKAISDSSAGVELSREEQTNDFVYTDETLSSFEKEHRSKEKGLLAYMMARKWDDARNRLKEYPKEAENWFEMESTDGSCVFRKLPLHIACMLDAPLDFVALLMNHHPKGVQTADECGMLPLHIIFKATRDVNLEKVQQLVEHYPGGGDVRDAGGRLPIELGSFSSPEEKELFQELLTAVKKYKLPDPVQQLNSTPINEISSSIHNTSEVPTETFQRAPATGMRASKTFDASDKSLSGLNVEKLIVKRAWAHLLPRLKRYPEEVKQWTTIKNSKGIIIFHKLPIHLACRLNAPPFIIQSLLDTFPESIKQGDDGGKLPLHHACTPGTDPELIEKLIRLYPASLHTKDNKGMLPLHRASASGADERVIALIFKENPRASLVRDKSGRRSINYRTIKKTLVHGKDK